MPSAGLIILAGHSHEKAVKVVAAVVAIVVVVVAVVVEVAAAAVAVAVVAVVVAVAAVAVVVVVAAAVVAVNSSSSSTLSIADCCKTSGFSFRLAGRHLGANLIERLLCQLFAHGRLLLRAHRRQLRVW